MLNMPRASDSPSRAMRRCVKNMMQLLAWGCGLDCSPRLVLLPDPLQRKRQTYSFYSLHKKSFLTVVDKDPSTRIARCIHLGKAAVGIDRVGPAQGYPSGHLPIDH